MLEQMVYREGRCRQCGMRVTGDCGADGHWRGDRCCGPVETEHPCSVPDEPLPGTWIEATG